MTKLLKWPLTCTIRFVQSKKVLIADEKANSRELLRIILEHEGCEVSEASDGRQAVAIARGTLPDLILLDLDLPGLNGFEAAREIRGDSRLKGLSLVALTESSPAENVDRLNEAGFTTCIAKPVQVRSFSGQLAGLGIHKEPAVCRT